MKDIIKKREPKRPIIIRVLQILEKYSDSDHLMKQKDIIAKLKGEYGLSIERKAVSNNLNVLKDMGFKIVQQGRSGVYLAKRRFSEAELRYLIDGVLSSNYISGKEKFELIQKIKDFGGINFVSHLDNIENMSQPSGNSLNFIDTIEILQGAIEKGYKLRMRYCKYNIDKELTPTTPTRRIISPYGLILHNQRYYLIGNYPKYDNLVFLRVDKIHDIIVTKEEVRPVNELPGYEDGLNLSDIKNRLPYLFPDVISDIVLRCRINITDDLIDWFGHDVEFKLDETDENYFYAKFKASPRAMKFWLLQYSKYAEVLEPVSLRNQIREAIRDMMPRYFSQNTYAYFKRLLDREDRKGGK